MATPDANLALIGLRCSGKSTIGPMVAAQLERPFIDLDHVTAAELGVPTAGEALRTLGQPAFRAGELHALIKTLMTDGQVISLGGGTPTYEDSLDALVHERNAGRLGIVYLRAQPEALKRRMAESLISTRPSLTGSDPIAEVDGLFAQRDPLYRQIAHRVIEVDELPIEMGAAAVGAWFKRYTLG